MVINLNSLIWLPEVSTFRWTADVIVKDKGQLTYVVECVGPEEKVGQPTSHQSAGRE